MRRVVFSSVLVVLLFLAFFVWDYSRFSDKKLHVVFCNVGQGDGIFLRTPSGKTILVDGGPDSSITSCLASHMPFWQRTITLMILSHPHADHLNGLNTVLESYSVDHFASEPLANKTAGYKHLLQSLSLYQIDKRDILKGQVIRLGDGVVIHTLGPSRQFLTKTSPKGTIGESAEFGSLINLISYGNFDVLLDGDSQVAGMKESMYGQLPGIEVLQVPHHGSRFGLDEQILKVIHPKLAVISVGKNKYGHPAPLTLGLLKKVGIRYMRTDQSGDIEIVSDGKSWEVK
jgi:competence protein ComEC